MVMCTRVVTNLGCLFVYVGMRLIIRLVRGAGLREKKSFAVITTPG